jgi:glycolate dehydrogenase FAD-binding subunit
LDRLKPRDEADCLEIVKWAVADKKPLEIMSGGSKRGYGRPVEAAALIDVSGLSGISLYEPEELVMTAGPGTRMAEIEKALRANNQELAFEPADYGPVYGARRGAATLGGVLAGNISGPRRIKAGAARDHFLGLRAVSGRGEVFKTGGRVVKNVTGYDLCKILAGSWGTLAILTEVTVKVLPAGQNISTVMVSGLTDGDAAKAMAAAMGSSLEVSGAAHIPANVSIRGAEAETVTAIRVEGTGPSVSYRAAGLVEMLKPVGDCRIVKTGHSRTFWQSVRNVEFFSEHQDRPLWRVSVAPMSGPDIVAALNAQAQIRAIYDWAGGLVWVEFVSGAGEDAGARIVRDAVRPLGGHATLVRADDGIRNATDVFHPQDAALAGVTSRLKDGFDPERILNPGRMYGTV